jgi:predicted DNA-binding transcriptional regulator AlpA
MSKPEVKVEDIIGLAEVCEIIGFTDGFVSHMMKGNGDFPKPIRHLKLGRIWDASEVRAWREAYKPNRPGRPYGYRLGLGGTEQASVPGEPVTQPVEVTAEDRKAKLDALLGGLA